MKTSNRFKIVCAKNCNVGLRKTPKAYSSRTAYDPEKIAIMVTRSFIDPLFVLMAASIERGDGSAA